MEEEREKYYEELKAKRKASEEARKKAEEKARKDAEKRAELAEEAKRKEEEELLMRMEAQRKKQEDLAKKRNEEEQRMRQEMHKMKQQKIAALSAAAARAASAVRKKKAVATDDRKKAAEGERSAAQVATPRVAAEDPAAVAISESGRSAAEELNTSRSAEVCEPDPRPNFTVALLGDIVSRRRLFANLLFLTGAWDRQRLERFQQELCNVAADSSEANASERNSRSAAAGNSQIRCGRFSTSARRFVLLDSPEPAEDMRTAMACAAQAHAAVLLVSAVEDLQAAVEPGKGALWQRAAILQAMGISRIIVVVECMEDPRVNWRRDCFEEVQNRVSLLLYGLGVAAATAVFVPVSNMMRSFLRERSSDGAWFKGPTLLEQLSALSMPTQNGRQAATRALCKSLALSSEAACDLE